MSTIHNTMLPDHIASLQALLEDVRDSLRTYLRALEGWQTMTRDCVIYTAADRRMQERGERVTAAALYELWEGSVFDVALLGAHTPWCVTLTYGDTEYGVGVSTTDAAGALVLAIEAALGRLAAEAGQS